MYTNLRKVLENNLQPGFFIIDSSVITMIGTMGSGFEERAFLFTQDIYQKIYDSTDCKMMKMAITSGDTSMLMFTNYHISQLSEILIQMLCQCEYQEIIITEHTLNRIPNHPDFTPAPDVLGMKTLVYSVTV